MYNLVAMNYQTAGKFMDIYSGRFSINGGCGYVLKPHYLRSDSTMPIDTSPLAAMNRLSPNFYPSNTPLVLHVKVFHKNNLQNEINRINSYFFFFFFLFSSLSPIFC